MDPFTITLQELVKMGLGTKHPDHLNVAVIHNLLKVILEKLEMKTHPVQITGPKLSAIRHMICHSRNPIFEVKIPIDYSFIGDCKKNPPRQRIHNFEKEINKLAVIVEKMEANLKDHLAEVKKNPKPKEEPKTRCKLKKSKQNPEEEENFSSECDDLCAPCDEANIIACDLLQHDCFIRKVMRRSTKPLIEKIAEFERTFEELHEKFQNFLNTAEDEFRKIPSIEECLAKLKALKEAFAKFQAQVADAILEIKDMLTTKLHKVHLPALKKYINDRLDRIQMQLTALTHSEGCPDPAAGIPYKLQCLCCTTLICQDELTKESLDKVKGACLVKKIPGWKPVRPPCVPRVQKRYCGGEHTVIKPSEKSLRLSNLIDDFGDKKKVQIAGGMYRMAT